MKRTFIIPVLVITLLGLSLVGFNQRKIMAKDLREDTIPSKKERKVRNLDDAIEDVDRGFDQMNKVDLDKVKQDIENAMKEVDAAKIRIEAEQGLRDADLAKAKMDLEKAIKNVDIDKVKAQLEAALASVDMEKIRKQIASQKVDLEKAQQQIKNMHPQIEKSMREARASLEKAKTELKEYKAFINDLEKDGLIDTKEDYIIKIQDGDLYINGKKQSDQVSNKYKEFIEKHKDFTIEKSADNFNIRNNK